MPYPISTEVGSNPLNNTGMIVNNSQPGLPQIFSLVSGDVVSMVMRDNSPLASWIPAVSVNSWNINNTALLWIAGDGFDGSQTYMEYITDNGEFDEALGLCDYGAGGMQFQAVEWATTLSRISFSNKDKPLTVEQHFTQAQMRQWQSQPQYFLRGDSAGLQIDSDAAWVTAMLAQFAEQHLQFNLVWGNPNIPSKVGMSEGLDLVIQPGYVASKVIGLGSPDFTDPLYRLGGSFATVEDWLKQLIYDVRRIVERARKWGHTMSPSDIGIFMPGAFWHLVADKIATGILSTAIYTAQSTGAIQMYNSPRDIATERARITTPNQPNASGFIPVDGLNVPVFVEDQLGRNAGVNNDYVIGDCYILTRNLNGRQILRQRYLNWNDVSRPQMPEFGIGDNIVNIWQNGLFRGVWNEVNQRCYWMGMDAYLGLESQVQPLQAKYVDLLFQVPDANWHEAGSYTHQDFNPYEGQRGGQGNTLITPIS